MALGYLYVESLRYRAQRWEFIVYSRHHSEEIDAVQGVGAESDCDAAEGAELVDDLGWVNGFGEEAEIESGVYGVVHQLRGFCGSGEKEDVGSGMELTEGDTGLDAVHGRHHHVGHEYVEVVGRGELQCLGAAECGDGVESGHDAAQFILLGASTVQVCTYVMKVGYRCVRAMCDELAAFMDKHQFRTLADFKGHSLPYFTTHADLVAKQTARKAAQKAAAASATKVVKSDAEWTGDEFVKQSDALSKG